MQSSQVIEEADITQELENDETAATQISTMHKNTCTDRL